MSKNVPASIPLWGKPQGLEDLPRCRGPASHLLGDHTSPPVHPFLHLSPWDIRAHERPHKHHNHPEALISGNLDMQGNRLFWRHSLNPARWNILVIQKLCIKYRCFPTYTHLLGMYSLSISLSTSIIIRSSTGKSALIAEFQRNLWQRFFLETRHLLPVSQLESQVQPVCTSLDMIACQCWTYIPRNISLLSKVQFLNKTIAHNQFCSAVHISAVVSAPDFASVSPCCSILLLYYILLSLSSTSYIYALDIVGPLHFLLTLLTNFLIISNNDIGVMVLLICHTLS